MYVQYNNENDLHKFKCARYKQKMPQRTMIKKQSSYFIFLSSVGLVVEVRFIHGQTCFRFRDVANGFRKRIEKNSCIVNITSLTVMVFGYCTEACTEVRTTPSLEIKLEAARRTYVLFFKHSQY